MHGAEPLAGTNVRRAGAAVLGAAVTLLVAATSSAAGSLIHVRDVRVEASNAAVGVADVVIEGTGAPTYSARVADGGRRLLIDLLNADLPAQPNAITTATGVVGGVLTQAFRSEAGSTTRVSIALTKEAGYRLRIDGTTLRVTFDPRRPSGPLPADALETAAAAPKTQTKAPAQVADVRFERGKGASSDRIVVAVSSLPAYALTTAPDGSLRLELSGTKITDEQVRMLDVTAYRGPIRSVSTFRDGTKTIVEVARSGDAEGQLAVEGTQLVWSFREKSPAARAASSQSVASPIVKGHVSRDGGAVRHVVTVARERDVPNVPMPGTKYREAQPPQGELTVETSEGAHAGFASTVRAQQTPAAGHYNGRRIDLDLKDADIHNILRLLAEVGHVNIVTADDVRGEVTIRMRNVPWDQALDVVLRAKGLGMERTANLIRVAPMAVLQKERELVLAQRKQEYELAPLETRLIPVSYAHATELQARGKDMLSPRGSLSVDERTNVLIARDIAANLNHVEELVRSLDTQTPQVLVEARIVEATSRYGRDIGIQWGGDLTFSEATGNSTGLAFPSHMSLAGGNYDGTTPTAGLNPTSRTVAQPNFAVNFPAAVGTGSGGALGLSFGSIDNTVNLGVRLSAAEATGMLRIVSSPRVLTLDNREAKINTGTMIPFSQVSAQGVQTTFQNAQLQLLVRPHVTADGSVSMHVKVNRDEPDFNQTSARGDPTILKREAETDLLVMDGHTAVIGGIYTRNTGRNVDQVPFFGDIPVLGILFQRRRASDTRQELVIFITPRIVNRAEALGR